ncbi:MAG: TatD family hydrolase [Ruminiclostridium sp.]|nr:TatD family hydrolase [Ruminiclostridium sp.]
MVHKIIDTHAHYDDEAFNADRDELIKNMLNTNVDRIITVGCSLERSRTSIELAERYDRIYASVGIHPDECYDLPDDYIEQLRLMSRHSKVVAIGEIGLDYHYEGYKKDIQIKCFKEQLELAQELNLPVIIHSREATQDTLDILQEYKPKGVMHCFSGSAETAQKIIDLGMMISFTGVLTFKNAKKAVEACKIIPMDRLMLETDCPYMTPVPHRGERNNSSYTYHTDEKVAEIKNMSVNEVIEICNANAVSFFNL